MVPRNVALALMFGLACLPAAAEELNRETVNNATYDGGALPEGQSPLTLKLQVLLDRAGISPGVIDGYEGENVTAALRAFEEREGLSADGKLDSEVWSALSGGQANDVLVEKTLSDADLDYPFVDKVPDDWKKMAEMDKLAYTSPGEMLAERHHMDIDLFETLNGGLEFSADDTVTVAETGGEAGGKIARIKVSRSDQVLHGFDESGKMIAHYPATVGSDTLPSPTGTHEVKAIAPDPNYTFDPKNIPEADVDEMLIIPPGPNGPVGTMWIDLSKPTYGIHGTSDPASIGKAASHGCVRLTNWDATELAGRVEQSVPVEFTD